MVVYMYIYIYIHIFCFVSFPRFPSTNPRACPPPPLPTSLPPFTRFSLRELNTRHFQVLHYNHFEFLPDNTSAMESAKQNSLGLQFSFDVQTFPCVSVQTHSSTGVQTHSNAGVQTHPSVSVQTHQTVSVQTNPSVTVPCPSVTPSTASSDAQCQTSTCSQSFSSIGIQTCRNPAISLLSDGAQTLPSDIGAILQANVAVQTTI